MGVEMEEEVKPPVVIGILDVASPVSFYRSIGAKFYAQWIDVGGIKGSSGEDGYRDYLLALGADGVVGAAGFDVDFDSGSNARGKS